MRRRDLLKFLSAAPLGLTSLPLLANNTPRWDRIVILIELKGANDSLNTFIPYHDPLYYQLRPKLAIPRNKVVPLSDQIGMHPGLQPLLPLWQQKQIALIHGLGYPKPSLSHFRSIEIWNTGSESDTVLSDGWLTQCFKRTPLPHTFTASGVSLTDDKGPLDGIQTKAIVMSNPRQFLNRAHSMDVEIEPNENPALAHIIEVQKSIKDAPRSMFDKLIDENYLSQSPFKSNIDAQLSVVAHLIDNGVSNPVYKLAHGSFDTHSNQLPAHAQLLQQLADALINFRKLMEERELWERVVVVTYSEFGRSPQENSKLGTEHGTAATHMILGGSVIGGHYGQLPALADLEDNNLKYTTDFRQLYATLLEKWWNIAPANHPFNAFAAFPLFV